MLASCRNNVYKCSVVCVCCCCCCCCCCCGCCVVRVCCVVCCDPSKRFMVTPVVCPRLFEFLATLTFGALRKNHNVSTAFETIAKKKRRKQKQRKPVVHVRSAMYHELSRTDCRVSVSSEQCTFLDALFLTTVNGLWITQHQVRAVCEAESNVQCTSMTCGWCQAQTLLLTKVAKTTSMCQQNAL